MLNFKKITSEDAEKLKPFLTLPDRFSCESNFFNLVEWADMYDNRYALKDGILYIKSGGVEEETFRLPFGGELKDGMKVIAEHAGCEYPPLWVQQSERFNEFKRDYGKYYEIIPERDFFDYVYLQKDLAALSGKKYHGKRNHISAFSAKYDWEYREITSENSADVLACAEKWYIENAQKLDDTMQAEKRGIEFALSNMSLLDIKGGAIYIDGVVAAFTLGSPINNDVFDINFEKALAEYSEAYAVINQEFAKTLGDYKYINREDDLGLDGLRKAKLSYKPDFLLEKYLCVSKLSWLKEMYHSAFAEDDCGFENRLFETCFKYLRVLEKDGRTVSMCFCLPCKIGNKTAKYIFALTTADEFRNNGYAGELIEKIKSESDSLLILRPSDQKLIPFYKKFGFKEFCASNTESDFSLEPVDEYRKIANDYKETSGSFTAMYYSEKTENLENLYFPYSMI